MNYDIIGGLTSERIFFYALVFQEEPFVTNSLADSLINSKKKHLSCLFGLKVISLSVTFESRSDPTVDTTFRSDIHQIFLIAHFFS